MTRSTFLAALTASLISPNLNSQKSPVTSLFSDRSRLLHCIAEVETGNNDALTGPKGELSKYQITRAVWYEYNPDLNFVLACNGLRAEWTARRHLSHLQDAYGDSPSLLAQHWKQRHGPPTKETREYTQRVMNLYNEPK